MYFDGLGRHQSFGKYLIQKGHKVKIFCASTIHNSEETIELSGKLSLEKEGKDGVRYVFVKTRKYNGNGYLRVRNMIDYYINVKKTLEYYQKKENKPDIILASSVHPLTLVAGIKIAHRFKCPCVCEVRDLWPESIVAYTKYTDRNIAVKCLYVLEKWIYKRADSLIFTIEGGKDYIIEKHWADSIDMDKIYYINNGVDLDQFYHNLSVHQIKEDALENKGQFKVVYAGAIRPANGVGFLIKSMGYLKDINVTLLIYGDGEQTEELKEYCRNHKIQNVSFRGKVGKEFIPYILSKSDLNILNYQSGGLWKYGGSQNKLFEYLASGTPILANIKTGYDPIEKFHCGIAENFKNEHEYSNAILSFINMEKKQYERICDNAKQTAKMYDFLVLTERLEKVLMDTIASNALKG